jgi:hypothetical protein
MVRIVILAHYNAVLKRAGILEPGAWPGFLTAFSCEGAGVCGRSKSPTRDAGWPRAQFDPGTKGFRAGLIERGQV